MQIFARVPGLRWEDCGCTHGTPRPITAQICRPARRSRRCNRIDRDRRPCASSTQERGSRRRSSRSDLADSDRRPRAITSQERHGVQSAGGINAADWDVRPRCRRAISRDELTRVTSLAWKRGREGRRSDKGRRSDLSRAGSRRGRRSSRNTSEARAIHQNYISASTRRAVRRAPRRASADRNTCTRIHGDARAGDCDRARAIRDADASACGEGGKGIVRPVTNQNLTVGRNSGHACATLRDAQRRCEARQGGDVAVSARGCGTNRCARCGSVGGCEQANTQRRAAQIDERCAGSRCARTALRYRDRRAEVVRVSLDDVCAVTVHDSRAVLNDANASPSCGFDRKRVAAGRVVPDPVLLDRVRNDDLHVRGQYAAELIGDAVQVRAGQCVRTGLPSQADRDIVEGERGALTVTNRVEVRSVSDYAGAVTGIEYQRCLTVDQLTASGCDRQPTSA